MSKGGSKVRVPVTLDSTMLAGDLAQLRLLIQEQIKAAVSTAQTVTSGTGRRAQAKGTVPFSMGGIEGEAIVSAEFDPEKEAKRRRRIQRRWNARRRRLEQEREKRLIEQERNENWLSRDQQQQHREEVSDRRRRYARRRRIRRAREKATAEEEKAARTRGMETSRMMMGGAGVLTALTMPISGFTPLTIGFASMSGVGFGIGAGVAVMARATWDASKALNLLQDEAIESAKSVGMISDRFKTMDARRQARVNIQGFIASEAAADRIERWHEALKTSRDTLQDLNAAYGEFRTGLSVMSSSLVEAGSNILGGSRGLLETAFATMAGAGGRGTGTALYYQGRIALAEMYPVIKEALENLEAGKAFSASFVKPGDVFNRMQQRLSSRRDKNEELLKANKESLEKLVKDSADAVKELKIANEKAEKANAFWNSFFSTHGLFGP